MRNLETQVRSGEARSAFLLQLSDALRSLSDAREIDAVATRMLREHLGVDGALFADTVAAREARPWTDDERALVDEVARRAASEAQRARAEAAYVTERREAEAALRESEQRQAFLLRFSDALRAETTAAGVADRALRMLNEHLELDRSSIGSYRLEDNRADLVHQVGNDTVPPAPDVFVLSDYPAAYRAIFDQTLVIEDELERQGLSEAERMNSGRLGMRAMVAATLRNGPKRPQWSMAAISSRPRRWTRGEIALVEEVAERTWAAMERARAEEALRTSEARYRTLFETMDEGFCLVEVVPDENGRVVDCIVREVNAAYARLSGHEGKDVLGRRATELMPNLERHWLDSLERVYKTGEPWRSEDYAADAGGWMRAYYSRVGGPGSRLVATVFDDITDRKLAEDDLRKADRQKDAFIATLSHELRNPVAAITAAGLLVADASTPRDQAREAAQVVVRQSKLVTRLLDDLLDQARIALGRFDIEKRRVTVASVVDAALEATKPVIDAAGQRVSVSVTPRTLAVEADATRLSQVIANLVTNASKYSERGQSIAINAFTAGDQVEIRVVDLGIGIAPHKIERLFDMFAQGDDDKDRTRSGMGIGLALARHILDLHGGSVRGESEGIGKGSRFRVLLPALAEQREPAPVAPQTAEPKQGARVLLVEDDRDLLAMFTAVLRALGYDAHGACGGRAGVTEADRLRPEVMVVDLGMPDLDGLEVARRIRATSWGASAVLIALTGWGQPKDIARARQVGFDVHLTKPIDPNKVRATIDDALKRRLSGP